MSANAIFCFPPFLISFPNIIEGNYNDASKWLLQTQGIINPSFRDTFSAGGCKNIDGIKVPRIILNIAKWKEDLIKIFNEKNLPQQDFEDVLIKIVKEIGKNIDH